MIFTQDRRLCVGLGKCRRTDFISWEKNWELSTFCSKREGTICFTNVIL